MKKFYCLLCGLIITFQINAQDKLTISGYVKDASNGEGLIGVSIYVQEAKVGTQTNAYGFYSITLDKGSYTVSTSYIGYAKQTARIELSSTNVTRNFELKEDSQILQEVVVSTKKEDDNVKSLEMSVNKVDIKTIQKMPALLGEVDIIKSIQFLPGVTTVGEGASGFNVRGGNIDQNLVLLDEAPVYNSSHLFGFFSVFNPDAVKDVKLYKGGIPAQYGGRVSSILDVRMKEGNSKKLEVNGGIGTIFSRLSVEAPIVKDKGSFIVALRRSYIDVLAKPFLNNELRDSKFYYYDFTAKANYRINEKNNIYLSGYFGRDVFGADFGFNWGNATTTFRWNHVFNNKLFLNTTVFYSNYDYSLGTQRRDPNAKDSFNWNSEIINYSVKPDFSYYLNPKNTITFGGQATYYEFKPGLATAKSAGEVRTFGAPSKYAAEFAGYIANEQKISNKLSLQYGIRYSYYQYLGKADAYNLEAPNGTADRRKVLSVTPFGKNEVIQDYGNFEPRFAMNLGLGTNSSIKLSYNRTAQYIHLLSNTTASSPLDVWTPSSNNIKPQIADQVALGYFYNFKDNNYESSVEVYYKDMQNQIDYVRGADLLLNPAVEADLLFGKGRAYGSEFYVKKNKGKLNGWISYTLARTERKIDGLNRGEWFAARIDKTHNLAVVGIYDLNKKWSFSSNFTFFTGTPASFPTNKFIIQGIALPHDYYDERNTYRISNYHRLDIAATLKPTKKIFKKGQGEWVFSVYNVYNRRNAFSEYVRQNPDDPSKTEAIRYAVFGSVIPAVTYNFKF
ncbi:MAG: TonB-dependent receptor [Spirosomataceae bacterium]